MYTSKYEKRGGITIKKFIQNIIAVKGDFLIPLGIGILIAAILMNLSYAVKMQFNVEKEARKLGMVYPTEIKAINVEP